jgi:hypothetical protein
VAANGLTGAFEPVAGSLLPVPGADALRVVLLGGLGGADFDDIRMWEE